VRVNLAKGSILPVEQIDNIQFLVGVLGCSIDASPTNYLIVPLSAKFKDKAFGILF